MKTFLTKMAPKTLFKIGCDLLGTDVATNSKNLVQELCQYLKAYRLNAADLKARYPELKDDAGLKNG